MTLSKIVVSGRVIKAPEKRFTPSTNVAVAEFSIAVEGAPRPDGSTDSTPIRIITWRELAERCSHELHTGDLVIVDGRLQINSFTGSEGQRRKQPEVEAISVENLTTAPSTNIDMLKNDVFEAVEEQQLVHAGTSRSSSSEQTAADNLSSPNTSDNIFATEDEIPF
jgi:single-strand DNA-binding protein